MLGRPVTCATIRAFLAQLDTQIDLDKLQDDTLFTEAGADSLDFFNVLTKVQTATGIAIADKDIEQVNTLAGMAAYLNTRLS